jgi:hypothetical protein
MQKEGDLATQGQPQDVLVTYLMLINNLAVNCSSEQRI